MKIKSRDNDNYYPQPEYQGGWRFLKGNSKIKSLTNVSLGKLDDLIRRYRLFFDTHASGIVIIRNGYIIKDHYSSITFQAQLLRCLFFCRSGYHNNRVRSQMDRNQYQWVHQKRDHFLQQSLKS